MEDQISKKDSEHWLMILNNHVKFAAGYEMNYAILIREIEGRFGSPAIPENPNRLALNWRMDTLHQPKQVTAIAILNRKMQTCTKLSTG